MGTVYLAWDNERQQLIAFKSLREHRRALRTLKASYIPEDMPGDELNDDVVVFDTADDWREYG